MPYRAPYLLGDRLYTQKFVLPLPLPLPRCVPRNASLPRLPRLKLYSPSVPCSCASLMPWPKSVSRSKFPHKTRRSSNNMGYDQSRVPWDSCYFSTACGVLYIHNLCLTEKTLSSHRPTLHLIFLTPFSISQKTPSYRFPKNSPFLLFSRLILIHNFLHRPQSSTLLIPSTVSQSL